MTANETTTGTWKQLGRPQSFTFYGRRNFASDPVVCESVVAVSTRGSIIVLTLADGTSQRYSASSILEISEA